MKILYVQGHPYKQSFHTAIYEMYVGHLAKTYEVEVLELGAAEFDPVLRYGYAKRMPDDPFITKSQELVKWADHIVFAFPLWWGDAPALMKGWIERVFTPGEMYNVQGLSITKLLKGRTADLIITSRGLRPIYWLFGNHGIGILSRNLFALTGIRKRRTVVLGGVGLSPRFNTAARREKFLAKVARTAAQL